MAGASLLTLIDDIASLLDDVAVLTKKAGAKTAGVLGDDLALNAQQVSGVSVDRELPVVWAVFKGSLVNKLILVPLALAISTFAPWAVTPLLTIGGLFLCFEGAEKLLHAKAGRSAVDGGAAAQAAMVAPSAPAAIARRDTGTTTAHGSAAPHTATTTVGSSNEAGMTETPAADSAYATETDEEGISFDEKTRVRGAIRTDFILSAEIIAITLGTVTDQPLGTQVSVLSIIALIMTIGVYGFVAAIVKLDDLGLYLSRRDSGLARATGRGILAAAPWFMKALSVAGTIAMFLVGGSIVAHGIPFALHAIEWLTGQTAQLAGMLQSLTLMLGEALIGLVAGVIVVLIVSAIQKLRGTPAH
ncbi:MAG: DUF808 domain-containing protein [Lautropia sp.]|nr:DUF808 domain-containing protein [Lautropia sp.]